ncbi:IMPACT family protein [Sediminitomix flava]|uniref:Putative YigZ family protein n=1 Tax=Sediminitomix flava TaxID=379075 RepID=A0A315ZGA0_SEDFL|nr:YigZ family protein [Sediminitomix flava]PWJ44150.1 putative YigZ family protein [Sediminitomix flava]
MEDSYLTIEGTSEGLYKEKGSKFLAFAYRVRSEEEVREIVQGLRKTYYDARHWCYAYILGADKKKFRANDDGEPGNSAGAPILGQIRSKELTDTLVVVVRYFGGTKLGVSGLINAYKTSAAEALEEADIIEEFLMKTIKVTFEYPLMNEVMKVGKTFDLDFGKQTFDTECHIEFMVREKLFDQVFAKLDDIDGVRVNILS